MKYRHLKGYKYEVLIIEFFDTGIKYVNIGGITGFIGLNPVGMLTVFPHYAFDGPSGPTVDTKTFMRGSLVHDALYQLMREGKLDRKYRKRADELLREICLEDGMNRFRAWYVYKAVRFAGRWTVKPRKNPRGKVVEILRVQGSMARLRV